MVRSRRQLARSQSASRLNNDFLRVSFMFEPKCPARFNQRGGSSVVSSNEATMGVGDLSDLRLPGDRVRNSGDANRRVLRHATLGRRHDWPHYRWLVHHHMRRFRRHLRRVASSQVVAMAKGSDRAYWMAIIFQSILGFAIGLYASHVGRWDSAIPWSGYQAFVFGRIVAAVSAMAALYGLYKIMFDKSAP